MAMIEPTDPAQRLARTLADAAHRAIMDHVSTIANSHGTCRSLHVELEVRRDGVIGDLGFWVEHKLSAGELVGLGGKPTRRRTY